MELFERKKKPVYAALIDIGSGSVLVSVIESDSTAVEPTILWSHREIAPLKQTAVDIPAKHLMATLLNAVLMVESKGTSALREHNPTATITAASITYTAPWSYTVCKTMNFTQPEPFTVTEILLRDIIATITKKIEEERVDREVAKHRGLTVINQELTELTLNGYRTTQPIDQQANTIAISHLSDVAETIMVEAVTELQKKILPRVTATQHSFMHVLYQVLADSNRIFSDHCLVNITYEATEIGIVRNGKLEYTTSVPVGINTLVRGYASALNIPHEEAYSFLREPYHSEALETITATKKNAVDDVTAEYKRNLAVLFTEQTDVLSIPKMMIVHNPQDVDSFIHTAIAQAAKDITHCTHTIRLAREYIGNTLQSGTQSQTIKPASISARYFHNQSNHTPTISL